MTGGTPYVTTNAYASGEVEVSLDQRLMKELKAYEVRSIQACAHIAQLNQTITQVRQENDGWEGKNRKLQDTVSTNEAFIDQLQRDTVELKEKYHESQQLCKQVLQEKNILAQQMADLTTKHDDDQVKLSHADSKLQDTVSTNEAFIDQLQRDTVALKEKYQESQQLCEQVLQEKVILAEQMADLTTKYDDDQVKLSHADFNRLRAEMSKMRLELNYGRSLGW